MVVATGAVHYWLLHQTFHYLPFLLLLLRNPAERIFSFFSQEVEPASFHAGLKGKRSAAAARDDGAFVSSMKAVSCKSCERLFWTFTCRC